MEEFGTPTLLHSNIEPDVVAFSLKRNPANLPDTVRLLFVPLNDAWNDFSFKFHGDVGIRRSTGGFEWLNGRLAFKDQPRTRIFLQQVVPEGKDFLLASQVQIPFVTLLNSIRDYLELTGILGTSAAEVLALTARDISILNSRNMRVPEWEEFLSSDAFTTAFMRNSESAFAFKNAPRVLSGQRLDQEDARTKFDAAVQFGQTVLRLTFDFSKPGFVDQRRIAVLIGQNGTGKTATLRALAEALSNGEVSHAKLKPFPAFNNLVVFAHSGAAQLFKESVQRPGRDANIYSLDPRGQEDALQLTSEIASMARGSEALDVPLTRLNAILRNEMPGLKVLVPITSNDRPDAIVVGEENWAPLSSFPLNLNEQRRLRDMASIDLGRPLISVDDNNRPRNLSLGQKTFITFAIQAVSAALPGSIFLIDEPENFMHPNLLSQFIRLLDKILEITKSVAIVATHSPYVVREVHQLQVFVLSRAASDGEIQVSHPRLKTLGANLSEISNDIFGDDLVQHLFQVRLRESFATGADSKDVLNNLQDELSLEALMRLRAILEENQSSQE